MRYFLLSYLVILLVVVFGANHYFSQTNEPKEEKIVEKSAISIIDINNAFIRHPEKWRACSNMKKYVWDGDDGYVDEKYDRYIVFDVLQGHDYSVSRDGDQLTVNLTCNFHVTYQLNIWNRPTVELNYPGGAFLMTAHYNEKNQFTGLSFN